MQVLVPSLSGLVNRFLTDCKEVPKVSKTRYSVFNNTLPKIKIPMEINRLHSTSRAILLHN